MPQQTILLDLDNTLLGNAMEQFIPAYFFALGQRLHALINGKDLRQIMMASVQQVEANHNPAVTNYDAFMHDFLQRLDVLPEVAQPIFDAFYREDFPRLQAHTTFRPAARPLVKTLLSAGHTVVVATNPLFPETAIQQRIAWAGVDDFPFARITTMENSHFIKPNPNYYQEILDNVGAVPENSWMIGDDLELDIAPTHQMGIKTWWITEHLDALPAELPSICTGHGTLAQFGKWAQKNLI